MGKNKFLLKEGTKTFGLYLGVEELNFTYNKANNNSNYITFLCLNNNGKSFQLGFPDNLKITIEPL